MSDPFRNKVEQYSPKSSPRGSRSPVVPRQDSSGTLKATISLGKNPSIVHTGPFYLIKETPSESELTGSTNLMAHYGLEHAYNKSNGRKIKDTLSSFLPHLPGNIDTPAHIDGSGLRLVIDKPPIGGKELLPLNNMQLSGFRLHPGPLPETLRNSIYNTPPKKKHKHKKRKHKEGDTPSHTDLGTVDVAATAAEKKHKKQKRHDEDKERKKRKKEKKKKKQKHPEHGTSMVSSISSGSQPNFM